MLATISTAFPAASQDSGCFFPPPDMGLSHTEPNPQGSRAPLDPRESTARWASGVRSASSPGLNSHAPAAPSELTGKSPGQDRGSRVVI